MDLLDRLLGHDAWTTRQLLQACKGLSEEALDRAFEMDQRTLRRTLAHIVENMETWTDLMSERAVEHREGDSIPVLMDRLGAASRELADVARRVAREGRWDDCFLDTLDEPPRLKTFGGAIGHVLTHSMHHRAQAMVLMEQVGLVEHVEGDVLTWETKAFGWGG
jgi:uncharacterized damage-inducible protein DinB